MIKLTGITWITTYNCNISCDHCFFETQGPQKYLDPSLIDKVLKDIKPTKHMFWQHLSGGEIFLKPERVLEIVKRIRKYFDKNIGLSTNGFWAKDIEKARDIVKELAKQGVTGIAISADYYHQQQMDIKGPQNLARIIKEEGIQTHSYIMGARLLDVVNGAKKINAISETIASKVEQGLGIPYARATERSIGKGSRLNHPKRSVIPSGSCTELNTCLGERSPFNPAMVWIDPYGNVMICYGVIIGNVYEKPFNKILEDYSPESSVVLNKLATVGPKGLYNLAIEKGIKMPGKYFDECDLCYQSREKLYGQFPEVLGPKECYPE